MDKFYKEPPRYNSFVKKICLLKRKYPFLQIGSIGKSYQGRRIHALFLGNLNSPTLLTAAFHAQEWLTESLLVMFCEQLCKELYSGSPLVYALKNRGVIIVPCVNPDGVELVLSGSESANEYKNFIEKISGGDLSFYNANIRGVDLNHNFDAGHDEVLRLERAQEFFLLPREDTVESFLIAKEKLPHWFLYAKDIDRVEPMPITRRVRRYIINMVKQCHREAKILQKCFRF